VIRVRTYDGPAASRSVVVIHGGPGTPGHMAPIARELASSFRVIEPLQRASGDTPLTVKTHVEDLHEVIAAHCADQPPALVGSSWGAMLALAYAARHPEQRSPIVLIGCGSFDRAARDQFHATLDARLGEAGTRELLRLEAEYPDPNEEMQKRAALLLGPYSHDVTTSDLEIAWCDARANWETWEDMVRLQDDGTYPAAFRAISAPVLMLHGAVDPHPGEMIHASLRPHLPQLEYREWRLAGHYLWLERAARGEFFAHLRDWLHEKLALD
jgi:pimeloyl-ACP methyl ester carboxylesterase